MSLGRAPVQADLLATSANFCDGRVLEESVYGLLHRECHRLFPDELFADLFTSVGRRSVPPRIVAVVMVLQRLEGLSDREAVDRFAFDLRWKYAAGGLDFDYPAFVHTVLVDMRARLAASDRPDRIFEVVLGVARAAGLVGRRRVLNSTPLYDAVATMDTITLIRSAVRGLLRVAGAGLALTLRAALTSGDEYADAAKPQIDWDDAPAREALVDSRVTDAHAVLAVVDGIVVSEAVAAAAQLLATAVGQDVEQGLDGVFRIARKVAPDRMISTVDPDARHGHKTSARGFDGYKGHLAIDPDTEVITAVAATPGNRGDAEVADRLLADLLPATDDSDTTPTDAQVEATGQTIDQGRVDDDAPAPTLQGRPAVFGDAAYGAGELLKRLDDADVEIGVKVQAAAAPGGRFSKDDFDIDLDRAQVCCPGGHTAPLKTSGHSRHAATARFGPVCAACPLATRCTGSPAGRTVTVTAHERQLAAGRARSKDPDWRARYRATRPKVERKIGHLMRRRHGGRRARVRGLTKVGADFTLLAAAVNLARLAVLAVTNTGQGWSASAA